MSIITIPKPLRERLGDEATDSLVTLLKDTQGEETGRLVKESEDRLTIAIRTLEKDVTERIQKLDKNVTEKINRIEVDMHQQFSEVHKAISGQTKWILIAILSGAVIYPIVLNIINRLLPPI